MDFIFNLASWFFLYTSIPILIRYAILRNPIKSKLITIAILTFLFISFSIFLNPLRTQIDQIIYEEAGIPYKPRNHMVGSPLLIGSLSLSYFILRKQKKDNVNFLKNRDGTSKDEQKPIVWDSKVSSIKSSRRSLNIDIEGKEIAEVQEEIIDNTPFNDKLYEIISQELEENNIVKPIWVKAFASSEGNHDKAKATYINLRFSSLVNEIKENKLREKKEKEKLLKKILDTPLPGGYYKTIDDLFHSAKKYGQSHDQYQLAKIFLEGKYITYDLESAKRWFILSAEQGYAPAISELPEIQIKLLGISKEAQDRKHFWSKNKISNKISRKCWKCGDVYHGSEYVKCLKCDLYLKKYHK